MAQKFTLDDHSLLVEAGWINGKPAKSASGRQPFEVYDPATDQVWAHQESMDERDTKLAIAAADEAFGAYSKMPSRQRARLLFALDKLVRENKEDLAKLVVMETGKSMAEARGEVEYATAYTWLMAGECERITGELVQHGDNPNFRLLISRHPIGPVGLLCPWNFPVVLALRKMSTALAAGCTVVIKPSPETPLTTTSLAILASRAGYADGVINVVPASTETTPIVGQMLCEDPRIKKISLTGSTPIGKLIMKQCASTLKKLTLELGGNGAWVVFDDADLEKAATGLIANKFRSAGQVCLCANRVFVQKGVLEAFTQLMKDKIGQLNFGPGFEAGVTNGALTTKRGAERAVELVKDAVKHGAELVTGGKRFGPGYHFEPTLLVGADKSACVYNEEMFAPICSIYPFGTEEEVLAECNHTTMGLTNYVWTKDISRAFRCSDALHSGTVTINTPNVSAAESPFGGIKESGMGKEGGYRHGVEEYCIVKTVALTI